jgi:hypothetical protein
MKQCLLGIMSRKIQKRVVTTRTGVPVEKLTDLAKYFVPATQIRRFVTPGLFSAGESTPSHRSGKINIARYWAGKTLTTPNKIIRTPMNASQIFMNRL